MTSPSDQLVRVSRERGVTWLTLDSPKNRNALSRALIAQLLDALRDATADDAVRAIALSHTGPVFCSGADLAETAAAIAAGPAGGAAGDPDGGPEGGNDGGPEGGNDGGTGAQDAMPAARLGEVLAAIWECPKPVVARVGGPARAGGIGLIAAADIAVCTREATFAFTEVRIGVVPAVISATVLRRLTPRAASELYLTGRTFDGLEAAANGLVTRAVPAEELDATVVGHLDRLTRAAPGALAGAKLLLREHAGGTVPQVPAPAGSVLPDGALRGELSRLSALSVSYFRSAEAREGIGAFWEKRPPNWSQPG